MLIPERSKTETTIDTIIDKNVEEFLAQHKKENKAKIVGVLYQYFKKFNPNSFLHDYSKNSLAKELSKISEGNRINLIMQITAVLKQKIELNHEKTKEHDPSIPNAALSIARNIIKETVPLYPPATPPTLKAMKQHIFATLGTPKPSTPLDKEKENPTITPDSNHVSRNLEPYFNSAESPKKNPPPKPSRWKRFKNWWKRLSWFKRFCIISLIILTLASLATGIGLWAAPVKIALIFHCSHHLIVLEGIKYAAFTVDGILIVAPIKHVVSKKLKNCFGISPKHNQEDQSSQPLPNSSQKNVLSLLKNKVAPNKIKQQQKLSDKKKETHEEKQNQDINNQQPQSLKPDVAPRLNRNPFHF